MARLLIHSPFTPFSVVCMSAPLQRKKFFFLFPFCQCVWVWKWYMCMLYMHTSGEAYTCRNQKRALGIPFYEFPLYSLEMELAVIFFLCPTLGSCVWSYPAFYLGAGDTNRVIAQRSKIFTHQVIFPIPKKGFLSRSLVISLLPNIVNFSPVFFRVDFMVILNTASHHFLTRTSSNIVFWECLQSWLHFIPLATPFLSPPLTSLLFSSLLSSYPVFDVLTP